MAEQTPAMEKLQVLVNILEKVTSDFGDWRTPWGEVNRFQRLTGAVEPVFDDNKPSLPVGYVSSFWGSLASYGSRPYPNTRKWYGTSGNSFVAAVEFGEKVKAKAILSGGVSGDPGSPHFTDQADMFCAGKFKDVLFYREDVEKYAAHRYYPGARK
jgi:acyl-homoserine lactone acylase PvdQ